MTMNRLSQCMVLTVSVCACTQTNAEATGKKPAASEVRRPNFIIILADDMGYADVQCYGNDHILTPHIDALAKAGMQFTDAHANSALSTPTRAAMLTGRYQQRAGLEGVILELVPEHDHAGLPSDQVTFARVLSENGYQTCLLGKWHLGSDPEYHPQNFGFTHFEGFLSGNVDYFTRVNNKRVMDWWNGTEKERIEGYTTSILTSKAVEYINANKDNPFCLVIAESCPHGPLQGPDDYALRYEGEKSGSLMIKGKSQRDIYKAMIEELDRGVGDIREALEKNGIAQNTLVVFLSDNGPTLKNDTGSAAPFREGKSSMFEGGHRVPFIASMPGTIKSGSVCETPVMGFDLFPTMLSMADISYQARKPLDGTSILPLFRGGKIAPRTLYWALGNKQAVRDGKWKLIVQNVRKKGVVTTEEYLFDMESDPEENRNLAAQYPSVVSELKKKLETWHEDVTSEHAEQLVPYIPSLSF